MFTGLVEEMGVIKAAERTAGGTRLTVGCSFVAEIARGDSVAVDGACLTASRASEALSLTVSLAAYALSATASLAA